MESLSNSDKRTLEVARMLREDFLMQNAFDPSDAYMPIKIQYNLLKSIITFYTEGMPVVTADEFEFARFKQMTTYKEIGRLKEKREVSDYENFISRVKEEIKALTQTNA